MAATKEETRFKIGDWIVHYYHGVGKVKDIVEKGLDGNQKRYYKVSTKDMDYWIPLEEESSDHIEPIRSKRDFEQALKIIEQKPVPIAQHHNTRKKCIHDRWMNGSLDSRAALLRDLYGMLKLDKLSFSEKEMMEKVRNYFISEWLITEKGLTHKQAKIKLRAALKSSVKKRTQSAKRT
jgi:RNA polymerase-interacting CarD/CdnL/TRCF family regulator